MLILLNHPEEKISTEEAGKTVHSYHKDVHEPAFTKYLKNKKKRKEKRKRDMNQNLSLAGGEDRDSGSLERTWNLEISELKIKVRRQDSTHWEISPPEWPVDRELEENKLETKDENVVKVEALTRETIDLLFEDSEEDDDEKEQLEEPAENGKIKNAIKCHICSRLDLV